jgi:hypothetical protein
LKVGVPANAISDANGNLGPSVNTESASVTIDVDVANGVTASTRPRVTKPIAPGRVSATKGGFQLASFGSTKKAEAPPSIVNVLGSAQAKRWLLAAGLPLIAGGLLTRRRRS